jgi:hypothetical protein
MVPSSASARLLLQLQLVRPRRPGPDAALALPRLLLQLLLLLLLLRAGRAAGLLQASAAVTAAGRRVSTSAGVDHVVTITRTMMTKKMT